MEFGSCTYENFIEELINHIKNEGFFDALRKEVEYDVNLLPAYKYLNKVVENEVELFLSRQVWCPDVDKKQLRNKLREDIDKTSFLDIGVKHIVDHILNPKISTIYKSKIEEIVYTFLGIKKPDICHLVTPQLLQETLILPPLPPLPPPLPTPLLPPLPVLPPPLPPMPPNGSNLNEDNYISSADLTNQVNSQLQPENLLSANECKKEIKQSLENGDKTIQIYSSVGKQGPKTTLLNFANCITEKSVGGTLTTTLAVNTQNLRADEEVSAPREGFTSQVPKETHISKLNENSCGVINNQSISESQVDKKDELQFKGNDENCIVQASLVKSDNINNTESERNCVESAMIHFPRLQIDLNVNMIVNKSNSNSSDKIKRLTHYKHSKNQNYYNGDRRIFTKSTYKRRREKSIDRARTQRRDRSKSKSKDRKDEKPSRRRNRSKDRAGTQRINRSKTKSKERRGAKTRGRRRTRSRDRRSARSRENTSETGNKSVKKSREKEKTNNLSKYDANIDAYSKQNQHKRRDNSRDGSIDRYRTQSKKSTKLKSKNKYRESSDEERYKIRYNKRHKSNKRSSSDMSSSASGRASYIESDRSESVTKSNMNDHHNESNYRIRAPKYASNIIPETSSTSNAPPSPVVNLCLISGNGNSLNTEEFFTDVDEQQQSHKIVFLDDLLLLNKCVEIRTKPYFKTKFRPVQSIECHDETNVDDIARRIKLINHILPEFSKIIQIFQNGTFISDNVRPLEDNNECQLKNEISTDVIDCTSTQHKTKYSRCLGSEFLRSPKRLKLTEDNLEN